MAALTSIRCGAMDAYEVVEAVPHGQVRAAAWNAYALETYGDKLLAVRHNPDFVSQDTAGMAARLFGLAARRLERSHQLSANPSSPGRNGPERQLRAGRH